MRSLFPLLMLLIVAYADAQTFTHTAALPKVESDGFYKIFISPEMDPYLASDYHSVRLMDPADKEVPYLIDRETPVDVSQLFRMYTIIEKRMQPGCCTYLTLKNTDKKPIDNISLKIRNADVIKQATLLGSDDRKQWYALKEQFFLYADNNTSDVTRMDIVNFPLSNYVYYSLRINDSTTAPLNILNAGFYESQKKKGMYTEIKGLSASTADSVKEKNTYINFSFAGSRFVDRIEFLLEGAPFYHRKAFLYEPKERQLKKGRRETYLGFVQSLELSSTHASMLSFPTDSKFKKLVLVIENEDNPPLSVKSANAYQLNRYFLAWLKKDTPYTLKFGKDLTVPSYDLVFFADSIPEFPTVIWAAGIRPILQSQSVAKDETLFTNNNIIWGALVIVIAALGFMSVKMVRETNAKKE
jgi:hypothetical protein